MIGFPASVTLVTASGNGARSLVLDAGTGIRALGASRRRLRHRDGRECHPPGPDGRYRIKEGDRSLVYLPDHEYPNHVGWGHSAFEHVMRFATARV